MLSCEFCKNSEFENIGKVVFLKTECDALMCKKCGNVIKNYNPDTSEFVEFYQNIGHDNDVLYSNKLKEQLDYLRNNINLKNITSVLEIGPGPKGLVSKLESKIKRFSCEIDENSIRELHRNGIENFKSLKHIKDKKFDLIILSHVFEHIVDELDEYISKLMDLTKKDGFIFIDVPSAEYELMIDNNILINDYFSAGHKRSSTEKAFELLLNRLNYYKYNIKTIANKVRIKEYKHRFQYSKILMPFCKNKNARLYFTKNLPAFLYHFIASIFYSYIVKNRNIPQANIKVLIQNEN